MWKRSDENSHLFPKFEEMRERLINDDKLHLTFSIPIFEECIDDDYIVT